MADATSSDACVDCGISRTDLKRKTLSRGRCRRCYQRHLHALKRSGTFESRNDPRPVMERFLSGVDTASNGCRLWTGTVNPRTGYGMISIGGKDYYTHRLAYTLFVGPIPDGMVIDHTCHNRDASCKRGDQCLHRRCTNPEHLEPVPHRTNLIRSHLAPAGTNSRKTHCKEGHEFTAENTITKTSGGRACRACHNLAQREYGKRRRAARRAA